MSWSNLLHSDNARERASERVMRNVAAFRRFGHKTPDALRLSADAIGITERRARTLFHRDGEFVVRPNEWLHILRGSIHLLRQLAASLRDLADQWDREADELEIEERQLNLWGREWERHGAAKAQRRAA